MNNNPTVSYTRGTDLSGSLEGAGGIGGLLARSRRWLLQRELETNHFYHADCNGNITYLVDSSQAAAATYRYDAFGNTLSSSGSWAAANVYRFSSKEVHVKSGMYIYLYRFYDPGMQRWLNRDPIAELGGVNLYRYVMNNPFIFVDPLGLAGLGPNLPPREPCEDFEFGEEGSGAGFGQSVRFKDLPPEVRPITIMPDPELSPLQALGNLLHQLAEYEEQQESREGIHMGVASGGVFYLTLNVPSGGVNLISGGPAPPTLPALPISVNAPPTVSFPIR